MEQPVVDVVGEQVAALGTRLLAEEEELAEEMTRRIQAAVPLYTTGIVPTETLHAASLANVAYIFGNIGRIPAATPLQTREYGRARARAGMPLAAVMAAYRVGARHLWQRLAETAGTVGASAEVITRAASDMWLILDTYTQDMADGYREEATAQAVAQQQQQSALVQAILGEDLTGTSLWEAADILRFPGRGSYLVIAAAVAEPGRPVLPGIRQRLATAGLASAWTVTHDSQTGIIATPADTLDIEIVIGVLNHLHVGRVGLSNAYPNLAGSAHALRQARIALRASTDQRQITAFNQHPIAVTAAAAPEVTADLAATTLAGLDRLPPADRTLLLDTFTAWFHHQGSASAAAARLHVHPNTVRYRLRRLEQLLGRSINDPRDIAELSLAINC
jgi:hypothetical protein